MSKPFAWRKQPHDFGTQIGYTLMFRFGPGDQDFVRWAKFFAVDHPRHDMAKTLRAWKNACRAKSKKLVPSA
jgi:hypothetical protein